MITISCMGGEFFPGRLAAFFSAHSPKDGSLYITRGDVEAGRSIDGKTWVPDLIAVVAQELRSAPPTKHVLVAHRAYAESPLPVIRGILIGSILGPHADVEDIVVHMDDRGEGIGRMLFQEFERIARAQGCVGLLGQISPENTASIRAARSWGVLGESGLVIKKLS
jgi:ribosomal protein S18 acetylase RimI-like enzyme